MSTNTITSTNTTHHKANLNNLTSYSFLRSLPRRPSVKSARSRSAKRPRRKLPALTLCRRQNHPIFLVILSSFSLFGAISKRGKRLLHDVGQRRRKPGEKQRSKKPAASRRRLSAKLTRKLGAKFKRLDLRRSLMH